jgi:hypothetical protein
MTFTFFSEQHFANSENATWSSAKSFVSFLALATALLSFSTRDHATNPIVFFLK